MRTNVRPRHEAPALVIAVMRPFMRYSYHRDAFVLRGVGNRYGPVLVRRQDDGVGASGLATRR
jgi:hypothetical protein